MTFDMSIDDKGRIMLPKQIRHLFDEKARIIWRGSDGIIMPLKEDRIVAKSDPVANPVAYIGAAIACGVTYSVEDDRLVVRGQYSNVQDFFRFLNVDNIDEYIAEE